MKNKNTKILFIICSMLIGFSIAIAGTAKFAQAINPATELNTPIPGGSEATHEVSGLAEYLKKVYNFGIAAAGILAMVMISVGGFMYLTSSYTGNVVKTASGMEYIKSALTGLAIVLLSYLLIYTLDPKLTRPQDVFLDIPATTCNGGMANVENAEECEKLCTCESCIVETDLGIVATYHPAYSEETKCCMCEENIECVGDNAHPNIPIRGCDLYCKNNCPIGKTCRIDSLSSDMCCKCFVTQYEDTDLICDGGIRTTDGLACNSYCSEHGETLSYDSATNCCMCNNENIIESELPPEINCDDYCLNFCQNRELSFDRNGTEIDLNGNCICSCY